MEPSDPVEIGRVVAPHGRCGTLRVRATGSGRHLRQGVEPFVAVGWDKALDLVAAELDRVRSEHGHRSIYAGSFN